jgi:hypothetical protein
MMMKKKYVVLMLVAMLAGSALAVGPELVANGDFQDASFVVNTVPTAWSIGGESSTLIGTSVNWKRNPGTARWMEIKGPDYSLAGTGTLGGAVADDIALQLSGGWDTYYFSFDSKMSGGSVSWFSWQVEFYDAAGGSLGYDNEWVGSYFSGTWGVNAHFVPSYSALSFVASTTWWTHPTETIQAPAYAVTAEISFMNYRDSVHCFDNVSLKVIPEPLTMSLLGLGGLMLRRRKK